MSTASAPILAEAQLDEACDRWLHLASVEAENIRNRNWPALAECQQALNELQGQVTDHLNAARSEWAHHGVEIPNRLRHFKQRAAEIVKVEKQNQGLLQQTREIVEAEFAQLQLALRTLQKVRSSYAPSNPPAWTGVS